MVDFNHGDSKLIHRVHRWEFLNSTDRLAGKETTSSSSVSITSVGTIATVTYTAHSFKTGNSINISGAVESAYNGDFIITVVSANVFKYTITATTSPATGTILAKRNITYTARDIGREARQLDDNNFWRLTNVITGVPTWLEMGASITAGTTTQYYRGDKTWQELTTAVVAEVTNLFFTNARAIAATLTGFTSGAGTITSSDSILSAIEKIVGNLAGKQDTLVSGTNIKTINSTSLLGSGDIGVLTTGGYGAQETFPIAIGSTDISITSGTVPLAFHFPYAFFLQKVKLGLTTVSSSGIVTVDIKKNGTSIFTTKITIDAGEEHSSTAATAAVLTSTPLSIASADKITFSIDTAGTGAKLPIVYLIGYATGAA